MITPVIAVDLDDTLRPWTFPLRAWVAEQLGMTDVDHRNAPQTLLAHVFGCTLEAGNQFANRFAIEQPGCDLAPFPDAIETLELLRQHYRLIVVTARLQSLESVTRSYIDRYFPGVFEDVIFASYQIDRKPKHLICSEMGARVIIDDRLNYVTEYAEAGMFPVLYGEYPWNRTIQHHSRIARARHWCDVPAAILSQIARMDESTS